MAGGQGIGGHNEPTDPLTLPEYSHFNPRGMIGSISRPPFDEQRAPAGIRTAISNPKEPVQ